jgi:hypothetical protein
MTADGRNHELGSKFGLCELKHSQVKNGTSLVKMYIIRSKLNVDNSDATLAIRTHSSPGTDKTISYCTTKKWSPIKNTFDVLQGELLSGYKPTFVITDIKQNQCQSLKDAIYSWITRNNIRVLNVCGHRDKEFTSQVKELLINVFQFPLV